MTPISSLLDLVQYLEEMPVEERTRSMLVYIEMAMGELVLGGSTVADWKPLPRTVPLNGQQSYCSQEELPSAVAAGVLDKLESHFSFVIVRLASLTDRFQQLAAEETAYSASTGTGAAFRDADPSRTGSD